MYRRASDFTVPDPLRQQLQRLDNAIDHAFRELESSRITPRRIHSDTTAAFGELIIVDSTNGSIVVKLPRVHQRDAGNRIVVVRTTSLNTVTIQPVAPDQINRATQLTLATTIGVRATVYSDGSEFWA